MSKKQKLVIAFATLTVITLAACSGSDEAAQVAGKYTEQTARAIIEGSWKIAGALLLGLIINGVLK